VTNDIRLIVEAALFTAGMLAIIAATLYGFMHERRNTPEALDKMRRLIDGMAADMAERMDGYDKRQARDRQEMDRLYSELNDWKTYSRAQADYSRQLVSLLLGMGYAGELPPSPDPPGKTNGTPGDHTGDDRVLAIRLGRAFNLEELYDLEFRLGVPDGDIGNMTVAARARELVRWCRRRGRIDDLILLMGELRPDGGN